MKIGGKNISNWWLIGGAIGVGAVYLIVKKGGLGGSGSSTAAGSQVDPVTGLPASEDNTIDPITGMTYLAEAQQYGSVQAAEQAVSSGQGLYGASGGTSALDSGFPTGFAGLGGTSTNPAPGTYQTNAQWAQAVTAGLSDLGYNSTDVAAALGLYFQNHPLGVAPDGASYLSIVQAAVAEFGPPPVGSFQITGAQPGPKPPPPQPHPHAKPGKPDFLHVFAASPTLITADWAVVPDAASYVFQVSPKDHSPHNVGDRTGYNAGGLKANTHYTVHVAAVNSAGQGPFATQSVTTPGGTGRTTPGKRG